MKSVAYFTVAAILLNLRIVSMQSYGDLRLVQGDATSESFSAGRLEIFIDSVWGSICADSFGMTAANVACRQLGYQGALETDTSFHTPHGRGMEGPIWLDEVQCSSDDLLHILSCGNNGLGKHDCDHFSDVAITCQDQPLLTDPQPMDVRLSGGAFRSQGTVEVYCSGQWNAVCDQLDFSQAEADAVCRQLGYTEAGGFDTVTATSQWLGQLSCPNETYSNSVATCGACSEGVTEGAAIECSAVAIDCSHTAIHGSVRLAQGSQVELGATQGRLEIYQDGKWGTVCSDTFNQKAANITCQQLDFLRAMSFPESNETDFGTGPDSAPVSGFQCTGEDVELVRCPTVEPGNCTHDQDVAVFCTNDPILVPPPGTPPLQDGKPKIARSTFIGIMVGCSLALLMGLVFCGVCSAHFYLVPYSTKKERHSLYFIEREGSAEAEAETALDQKLSALDLDPFAGTGKSLGDDFIPRSTARPKNKYVPLNTSQPCVGVSSAVPQPGGVPQPQEATSVPVAALETQLESPESPCRVSVHSFDLPYTPLSSHPSTPLPQHSTGGGFNLPSSGSHVDGPSSNSPSTTTAATSLPAHRQQQQQQKTRETAADDMFSAIAQDNRLEHSLTEYSYMSESDPMLAARPDTQEQLSTNNNNTPRTEQAFFPTKQGSMDQVPLSTTTTDTSGAVEHATPTKSIMKSPSRAAAKPHSMPHLDCEDTKAANFPGEDYHLHQTAGEDLEFGHSHNHHVSFQLDD